MLKSIPTANGETLSSSALLVILVSPKSGKQRPSGDLKLSRCSAHTNHVRCVKEAETKFDQMLTEMVEPLRQ